MADGDDGVQQVNRTTSGESPVDRMTDAAGSSHVPLAVGVFATLGVALVFASFMSSAFTSGGGGGLGLAASVGFALAITPLLAVLTGTWAARTDEEREGHTLSAAFGGVAGVFALYVAYYAVGSALGVGAGTVGIGPLFGWAVGVGVVAALSALLVTSVDRSTVDVDVGLSGDALVYSVGAFVALGIGLIVALFAAGELASSSSGAFAGFSANTAASAPSTLVTLAPVLGLLVGLVSASGEDGVARIGSALVGAGVGFVLAYLVVFGLAHALEPDAMDGIELQYGAIVGVAVGVAIAGGLGSWVRHSNEIPESGSP